MPSLFVHGIGEQPAGFADLATRRLTEGMAEEGLAVVARSAHWAPLADRLQRAFLQAVEAAGSKGNLSQRLAVGTLADAILYLRSPSLQAQIFRLLDSEMWLLRGNSDRPVTIFAHSLGGLIVTDYLRSRPWVKSVRLVTFGCNIGLFTLGTQFEPLEQLRAKGSWINLFSRRDALGFPLSVDPALAHVHDYAVSVGGWFRGWTGLAHTLYWDDRRLWRDTIPSLLVARKLP